jgi:hypothetical protein
MGLSPFSKLLRHPYVIIVVACAIAYVPFSNKAFFMDSPVTVYMARQLLKSPVDPPIDAYGMLLAPWNHTDLPTSSAYYATPHPPLVPLYLAPFVAVFGEDETVLNWAMFPFFALSIVFFYGIASLLISSSKRVATLLFAISPVVFVNMHDIMLDVPLMACTLGSLLFLLRARNRTDAIVSGIFAALACLTKFTGGTLVVSGIVFFVLSKKWKDCAFFLVPIAVLYGGWTLHNYLTWGNLQLFANGHARYTAGDIRYRFERFVSFFGGTVVVPPLALFIAFYDKRLNAPSLVAGIAAAGWSFLLWQRLHYSVTSALVYAVCAWSGIVLLLMAGKLLRSRPAPQRASLAVHVAGQIAGGLFLTSYGSRYMLPFAFLGILGFAHASIGIGMPGVRRVILVGAVISAGALSAGLSISGFQFAQADKDAAARISALASDHNVYYSGRLGYLYYMNRAGARSLLRTQQQPRTADFLVRNEICKDDGQFFGDTASLQPANRMEYPIFPLRGISGRAGFYGDDRLPYAWVESPAGRAFSVYRKK